MRSSDGTAEVTCDLEERAYKVSERAYAPYSRFRVGAALRSASGGIYTGCNVENSSYGLTMCAERNAIAAAVSAEGAHMIIEKVVVVSPDASSCSPCGACRQVLAELAPKAAIWFLRDNDLVERSCDQLLPERFG